MISGHSSWACIGDFNDLLDENEKQGGRDVNLLSHVFLRNFSHNMRALDIGFTGNPFTWCNRRGGGANI